MELFIDLTTPKIDFEGDSQRLLEGSNYTFTCSVQSYPNNYSIQWYHNGKIIEKEIHNKLHLQAVTAMDSGRYECNARGELQDKNVSIVARVEGDIFFIPHSKLFIHNFLSGVVLCFVFELFVFLLSRSLSYPH